MTDVEHRLRDALAARSRMAPPPHDVSNALRRTRRRQLAVAAASGLSAVMLLAAAVAGVALIRRADAPSPAAAPTVTRSLNGISISIPERWVLIDPDAAGLNGSTEGDVGALPRLVLAVAPSEAGRLFACPGMSDDPAQTLRLTVEERPLALAGDAASPWPVKLEDLVPGGGPDSGCYPGWTFLRAGWTAGDRTFEARLGFAPEISDDDRDALLSAFESMTFAPGEGSARAAVVATGTSAGETWEVIASVESGELVLSMQAETFGSGAAVLTRASKAIHAFSHRFGSDTEARLVTFGAVPASAATVEATSAAGDPVATADVVDIPDEIHASLDAFVLVTEPDVPVDLTAYDEAGNVVARGHARARR